MRISNEYPPATIYDVCVKKFGVSFKDGTVFTYGDTIFSYYPITDGSLIAHEKTHIKQQKKIGVSEWWKRYLEDPQFRLKQELEAYTNQYQWAKKNVKSREDVFRLLVKISRDLGGPMYGNIITPKEAMMRIKNGIS